MHEKSQADQAASPASHSELGLQKPRDGTKDSTGVLAVVEGPNDIEFLRRISRILHVHDATVPDLAQLEQARQLLFIPFCGGGLPHWSHRLEMLGWREFHLYDREVPPETRLREQTAKAVNARLGCQAAVTRLRALENYLHPAAIQEVSGITATFSGTDSVTDVIARTSLPAGVHWSRLSTRTQKRLRNRVKRWLNRDAVDRMTPLRLAQQDPEGEVRSWLRAIDRLAGGVGNHSHS